MNGLLLIKFRDWMTGNRMTRIGYGERTAWEMDEWGWILDKWNING